MAFMPKRVKYRKSQRGKIRGIAASGARLTFGEFGLKALENGYVSANHIEAARVVVARKLRGAGKIWINSIHNAELDRLIQMGEITYDKEARKKIYRDIHRLIYEEQLACFLYFPFEFHAASKKIGNPDIFLKSQASHFSGRVFRLLHSQYVRRLP